VTTALYVQQEKHCDENLFGADSAKNLFREVDNGTLLR
jgi:hypothetical protein